MFVVSESKDHTIIRTKDISQVKIESNDGKYCIVFLRYEDENTGAIRLGIRWYYPTEKERDTAFSNLATSLADREG